MQSEEDISTGVFFSCAVSATRIRGTGRVEHEASSADAAGVAKKVILAEPRGFCAGVRRAITVVEEALRIHGPPVYVRKEIVHNHRVVAELSRRGVVFVDSEDEVPEGAVCIFSAHGVAPQVRRNAEARRLDVIDATCPLVTKVHQEARRFADAGRSIVLIGHREHEEVEGTYGEAPHEITIVEKAEDVAHLELPGTAPLAFLTQTTLSVDETEDIVQALRRRYPSIVAPGTGDICYASQNRQDAVKVVAARSDLVLVVGSRNSSNSLRMVEVARSLGVPAYLVPEAEALDEGWLDGVRTVGVSSGASAPEVLVEELLGRLGRLGYLEIETARTAVEDVVFKPPAQLSAGRAARVPEE